MINRVALAKTAAPAMADGEVVALSVDPSDGGLRVHSTNGGGGGNGAASNTGSAVPAQADYQGINVGGTLRGAVGYDLDSGGGTEYVQGTSLRKSASGGSVELGTLADPVRVDPTGTTAQPITENPTAASGGLDKFHLVSAASTNANNVKASAGRVYQICAFNLNASPRYLKLHNTSGTPTAGSGVTDTFMIPGNAAGAGLIPPFPGGITFSTGIGMTLVTGITDADANAVAANEIVLQIYYK